MIIIDINGEERNCQSIRLDSGWPGYLKIHFRNEKRSYDQWYPISDFLKNNPNLSHLAEGTTTPPDEVVGIVTSSEDISLTDSNQDWKNNLYSGIPVWISRGNGEGQVRTVVYNNQTTLTIDKKWDNAPDTTSQFIISYNVHNPQVEGNVLPQINQEKLDKKIKVKKTKPKLKKVKLLY